MPRLALKAPWVVCLSFSEPKGRDKSPGEDTSSILGDVIPRGFFRVTFSSSFNAIPRSQGPRTAHLSLSCDPRKHRERRIPHLSLQDICSQPHCKDLLGKELRFLQDLYPLPLVKPIQWLILSTAWETGKRRVPHILSILLAGWGWGRTVVSRPYKDALMLHDGEGLL